MPPLFGGGGVLGDAGGLLSGVACGQSPYLNAGGVNASGAEDKMKLLFGIAACRLSCLGVSTSAETAAENLQGEICKYTKAR